MIEMGPNARDFGSSPTQRRRQPPDFGPDSPEFFRSSPDYPPLLPNFRRPALHICRGTGDLCPLVIDFRPHEEDFSSRGAVRPRCHSPRPNFPPDTAHDGRNRTHIKEGAHDAALSVLERRRVRIGRAGESPHGRRRPTNDAIAAAALPRLTVQSQRRLHARQFRSHRVRSGRPRCRRTTRRVGRRPHRIEWRDLAHGP